LTPAGRDLFHHDARLLLDFWSEHSERHTLPSWAAAEGAPPDWVDSLGGGRLRGGEVYVETVTKRIEKVQVGVAQAIRRRGAHEDIFEAEALALRLSKFGEERGVWPEVRERALVSLDYAVLVRAGMLPGAEVLDWGALAQPIPVEVEEGEARVLPVDAPGPPPLPEGVGEDVPGERLDPEVFRKRRPSGAIRDRGTLPPEVEGWCIAITKAKVRRLHFLRRSPKVPIVDDHDAEVWGAEKPGPEEYHDWCRHCFGQVDPAEEDLEGDSSASTVCDDVVSAAA
jgi:hypothetical protein